MTKRRCRRGEWSNHARLANAARLIFCKPASEFTALPDRRHVLADIGITGLERHQVDPTEDLAVDFVVPRLRRTGTACASESVGARPALNIPSANALFRRESVS